MNLSIEIIEYIIGGITIFNLSVIGTFYTYKYYQSRYLDYVPISEL